MRNILEYLEDLEGKTIESVEIDGGYSPNIVLKTNDNEILVLSVCGSWDRCGDFEGCEVEVETHFDYNEKISYDLLTEKDIEEQKIKQEKLKTERKRKAEEEKSKAEDAAEKMRKSELELLERLKNKYEK